MAPVSGILNPMATPFAYAFPSDPSRLLVGLLADHAPLPLLALLSQQGILTPALATQWATGEHAPLLLHYLERAYDRATASGRATTEDPGETPLALLDRWVAWALMTPEALLAHRQQLLHWAMHDGLRHTQTGLARVLAHLPDTMRWQAVRHYVIDQRRSGESLLHLHALGWLAPGLHAPTPIASLPGSEDPLLHQARSAGVVQALLAIGQDPGLPNSEGQTAGATYLQHHARREVSLDTAVAMLEHLSAASPTLRLRQEAEHWRNLLLFQSLPCSASSAAALFTPAGTLRRLGPEQRHPAELLGEKAREVQELRPWVQALLRAPGLALDTPEPSGAHPRDWLWSLLLLGGSAEDAALLQAHVQGAFDLAVASERLLRLSQASLTPSSAADSEAMRTTRQLRNNDLVYLTLVVLEAVMLDGASPLLPQPNSVLGLFHAPTPQPMGKNRASLLRRTPAIGPVP